VAVASVACACAADAGARWLSEVERDGRRRADQSRGWSELGVLEELTCGGWAGFSRIGLFRENLRELFVDLGGN
jgi:hypothetical protein